MDERFSRLPVQILVQILGARRVPFSLPPGHIGSSEEDYGMNPFPLSLDIEAMRLWSVVNSGKHIVTIGGGVMSYSRDDCRFSFKGDGVELFFELRLLQGTFFYSEKWKRDHPSYALAIMSHIPADLYGEVKERGLVVSYPGPAQADGDSCRYYFVCVPGEGGLTNPVPYREFSSINIEKENFFMEGKPVAVELFPEKTSP